MAQLQEITKLYWIARTYRSPCARIPLRCLRLPKFPGEYRIYRPRGNRLGSVSWTHETPLGTGECYLLSVPRLPLPRERPGARALRSLSPWYSRRKSPPCPLRFRVTNSVTRQNDPDFIDIIIYGSIITIIIICSPDRVMHTRYFRFGKLTFRPGAEHFRCVPTSLEARDFQTTSWPIFNFYQLHIIIIIIIIDNNIIY